jgi:hypothetical protein
MLLRLDILDGTVAESMKPKQVFQMRPEYELYGLKKFRSNLYSLRDRIKENHAKADSDSAALAHDCCVRPRSRPKLPRATHDGTDPTLNDFSREIPTKD